MSFGIAKGDICPECNEPMDNMTGSMHFCPPAPRYVEAGLAAMLRSSFLNWQLSKRKPDAGSAGGAFA